MDDKAILTLVLVLAHHIPSDSLKKIKENVNSGKLINALDEKDKAFVNEGLDMFIEVSEKIEKDGWR